MPRKIVAIGEILWDLLPDGRQLGGAPANFAFHARQLGADVELITRVGNDAAGRDAVELLGQRGLPTSAIQFDPVAPTGTVSVEFDAGAASGPAHRFTIHQNVAWDNLVATPPALAAVRAADALCFGSLGQRSPISRRAIQASVAAAPAASLRVFDVNLRQDFFTREVIETSLTLASALKMNDEELPVLCEMFRLTGDIAEQMAELARRFDLRLVALTRGRRGSLLYSDGAVADHNGLDAQVVDSIGAGDAFTAALTLDYLAGWSLDAINDRANRVAAEVCRHAGAMAPLPDSIRAPFGATDAGAAANRGQ